MSEPMYSTVYEWQWLESRNGKAIFVDYGTFLTENEVEKLKVANEYFYKIEWTKRERKQRNTH